MDNPAPALSNQAIETLLMDYYGLQIEGCIRQLDGYDDKNYHIEKVTVLDTCHKSIGQSQLQRGVLLKITNPAETANDGLIEAHTSIIQHLNKANLPTPIVFAQRNGDFLSRTKLTGKDGKEVDSTIRLMSFLPGVILKSVPISQSISYELGKLIAQYRLAVSGADGHKHKPFSHAKYAGWNPMWSLASLEHVRARTTSLDCKVKQELIHSIIDEYNERMLPVYDKLPSGIIHSDFNEANVLVMEADKSSGEASAKISGLLDFGDTHYGPWMVDVSTAAMYMTLLVPPDDTDPLQQLTAVTPHLMAAYCLTGDGNCTLGTHELHLMRIAMLARLTMTLVLGWHASLSQPNNDYILNTQATGWATIRKLYDIGDRELLQAWGTVMKKHYGIELNHLSEINNE